VAGTLRVGILGIGEAGSRIAGDLVALGVDVRSWDPDRRRHVDGVRAGTSPADAVSGSDAVLSLSSAAAAVEAAQSALPALDRGQVFADLNSTSPRLKEEVAGLVEPSGALFADVALLGSVPLRGVRTPALASGSGAAAFAELFRPFGMPVEVVEGGAGAAATRKLVRSVFMKGLAAAALESVRAAEAAGCEEWLRGEIAGVLDGPGEPLLERLLAGSRLHAERRMLEMEGAADLLRDLGVEPRVAAASVGWLEELGAENDR
jgi:3-hydroxyisobutyrate dehydrogenase-like beta-hydroxyacid dehydrogenase